MSLSLEDIAFLQSEDAQETLHHLSGENLSPATTLKWITTLRKMFTLDQASALLTTAQLRQNAITKFPENASQMLFTDDALQQASDFHIRKYRASLISGKKLLDVCCSIGSDAISYAQSGNEVLGLDIDPVRIAIAEHNASVCDTLATFSVQDVTQMIPDDADMIFFDPARRTQDGNRIFDVNDYIPPLSLIQRFQAPEIAVKLSPAVDLNQLEPYGGQVEFISVEGDLKEAVLWVHQHGTSPLATLIQQGKIHHFQRTTAPAISMTEPRIWLFEPDPSILRAGLVQDLAETLNATLLDETIAYLTMDEPMNTVWGRYWKILDWMPFNLKKLRAYLREHQVRNVTVKKRGFPMLPEEIITSLKLKKGDQSRVLVFTRCAGSPIVMICGEQ